MKATKIKLALILVSVVSAITAQEPPVKIKELGIGLSNFNSFSLQYRWGNEKKLYRLNGTIGGSTSFGKGSNSNNQIQDTLYKSNSSTTTKTSSPLAFNAGLSFSVLHIKQISDRLGCMYGPVIGLNYSTGSNQTTETGTSTNYNYYNTTQTVASNINNTTKNTSSSLQPFFGIVLGAVYKINSSFLLYAEVAPNIYYSWTRNTRTTSNVEPSPYNTNTNDVTNKNTNNTFGIANLSNSAALLTLVYRIKK